MNWWEELLFNSLGPSVLADPEGTFCVPAYSSYSLAQYVTPCWELYAAMDHSPLSGQMVVIGGYYGAAGLILGAVFALVLRASGGG